MDKILFKIINYLNGWYIFQQYEIVRKKYQLPKDFGFNGKHIRFHGDGKLIIGEKSYVGNYTNFQLEKDCFIKLRKGCSISHNVRIYTSTKIPDYNFEFKSQIPLKRGNVEIGTMFG